MAKKATKNTHPPRELNIHEAKYINGQGDRFGKPTTWLTIMVASRNAKGFGYTKGDPIHAAIKLFFKGPVRHPMRLLLNEGQIKVMLKALRDFGYEDLTEKQLTKVAQAVHLGKYKGTDVIAGFVAHYVDDLQAAMRARGLL